MINAISLSKRNSQYAIFNRENSSGLVPRFPCFFVCFGFAETRSVNFSAKYLVCLHRGQSKNSKSIYLGQATKRCLALKIKTLKMIMYSVIILLCIFLQECLGKFFGNKRLVLGYRLNNQFYNNKPTYYGYLILQLDLLN